MAVSGSTNYSRTASQIIRGALRILGVNGSDETPEAIEEQNALEALEMMIKTWQAQGIHLWTYEEATLFLTASTVSYSLPGARAVSTYVETTTSADAANTDTTITATSISGIADGDAIGVVTSSSAIHWTTVNGAPSGSTITLTDALTSDVSSGATVYAYTAADDLIDRPLRIPSIERSNQNASPEIDTPMGKMSRDQYRSLPIKTTTGVPNQYYYDPKRSTGTLYIWPAPQVITDLLKINYLRPIQDFDSTANDPDFPQEWLETLKYQLATRLAAEYGRVLRPDVAAIAADLLETLKGWDVEDTDTFFQPDFQGWD